MKSLMKLIKERIKKEELSFPDLERKTGVDRVVINDAITGKTAEMKFENFLCVVSEIYRDVKERNKIIRQFITLCKKNLNVRKALCYCQGTGEYEVIDYLVNKHSNCKLLNKYLKAYKLFNKRNQDKKRGQPLLDEINKKVFPNDPECQVVINILYALSMHDIFNIRAMNPYLDKVEKNLVEIKDGFIRNWLSMYFNERMAYVNLFDDKLEICREKCRKILDNEMEVPITKATALCCMGESYMFLDVLKSEKYLLDCIKYLEDNGIGRESRKYKSFQSTLAFLYIDNGFNLDKIKFEYLDTSEIGYFEGLYGDKNKALKIFKQLAAERKMDSPFTMYYISRINNDILGLRESLRRFERVGNYHYANAVRRTLASIVERVG
ncbi:AimR family lysis-lysogeny pheromone receptor [Bacillus cereus]|uniref:AimR family lysis-lysogeny pheromone receptor n=1 Tax=Bacillus cereus TaxID=1396 RepID=UPI000B7FFAE6|nr:AimR family lysis-lysogeny pheromone receptor [Bacillus cereus]